MEQHTHSRTGVSHLPYCCKATFVPQPDLIFNLTQLLKPSATDWCRPQFLSSPFGREYFKKVWSHFCSCLHPLVASTDTNCAPDILTKCSTQDIMITSSPLGCYFNFSLKTLHIQAGTRHSLHTGYCSLTWQPWKYFTAFK